MPFVKMHGLGNDYIYVDCFVPQTAALISKTNLSSLAQRVSDRHFGIGSDGLVLILPSKEADAKMRIFNADGSEAQMLRIRSLPASTPLYRDPRGDKNVKPSSPRRHRLADFGEYGYPESDHRFACAARQ